MSRTLRVLVVDDEELARVRVKGLLAAIPGVECVGEAENGIEAVDDLPPVVVPLLEVGCRSC